MAIAETRHPAFLYASIARLRPMFKYTPTLLFTTECPVMAAIWISVQPASPNMETNVPRRSCQCRSSALAFTLLGLKCSNTRLFIGDGLWRPAYPKSASSVYIDKTGFFKNKRAYNRFTIGSPKTLKMFRISINIRLLEDITTVLWEFWSFKRI